MKMNEKSMEVSLFFAADLPSRSEELKTEKLVNFKFVTLCPCNCALAQVFLFLFPCSSCF